MSLVLHNRLKAKSPTFKIWIPEPPWWRKFWWGVKKWLNLHNRLGAESTSVSMSNLEESARDRKNQLETIGLLLKKMVLHLRSMTDVQWKPPYITHR
jgi:hypothetical protein